MVRRFVVLLAVALLTWGVSLSPVGAQVSGTSCVVVEGTIHGISIPRFEEEALVGFDVTVTEVDGQLAGGKIMASLTITEFLADGSLVFNGTHHFTGTEVGTFTTSDHGLTSAEGRVADILTITEGATGFLVTMGHVNLETGELVLEYTGLVCPL